MITLTEAQIEDICLECGGPAARYQDGRPFGGFRIPYCDECGRDAEIPGGPEADGTEAKAPKAKAEAGAQVEQLELI